MVYNKTKKNHLQNAHLHLYQDNFCDAVQKLTKFRSSIKWYARSFHFRVFRFQRTIKPVTKVSC